jgi:hypothetical protein
MWVETLYVAPGHPQCRVYAMPYPMGPHQKPADFTVAHQLQDWREVARLDSERELVYIEPGYAAFASDIVGRAGGTHFEVIRHAA